MTFLGIFSTRGEKYYFMPGEIEPMRGEIETNIGKLGTRKNSNFFFGWRGPLVMIFGGVGQEGHVGVGAGGLAGSQMGQGSGGQKGHMAGVGGEYRGERGWQGAEGQDGSCWVGGGRRRVVARWQGGSGARGGMALSLGQGGPDGRGGRVQESQMAVAGGGGGRMARWQEQWGQGA